jgi:uncharacterized membrane protein
MQSETTRVEAFSDAVFAIAITLLILEIKVPTQNQGPLVAGLLRQWPSYLAFLASFLYIGVMWINHHRMFTHIKKADDALLVLNLFLLLGVTVIPFPTAVLAEHLHGPDHKSAAILYNATFVVIAVMFNVLWRYAVAGRLVDHAVSAEAARNISRQYALGPILYLVCFALAWINVHASMATNVALALFFALPPSLLRKHAASAHPGS